VAILSEAEALTFLGLAGTATTAQRGALNMLLPMVEQQVKGFVGYQIEEATYTHYLPIGTGRSTESPEIRFYDVQNGKAVAASAFGRVPARAVLYLPEIPVRSIASVYEDETAYADQGDGDFPASTLLASGDDYYLDIDSSGLCKSGALRRIGANWPTIPRTVKVTYTAGYTQAELTTGIAADIKLACLLAVQQAFAARGRQSGVVQQEKIGDYFVSYESVPASYDMPVTAKKKLRRFVRCSRFL